MSKPDFGGNVVKNLDNGQTFTVLGMVENNWLAIADSGQKQLLGYIQPRAGVQSDLYDQTLKPTDDARDTAPRKPASLLMDKAMPVVAVKTAPGLSTRSRSWIIYDDSIYFTASCIKGAVIAIYRYFSWV